jgi:hypothetical protein
MKYLALAWLLLPTAASAYPGTLSMERSVKLIWEVRRTSAEIPVEIESAGEWSHISTWLQLTGGMTMDEPGTDLGSQLGLEWSLKLGVTPNQAPNYRDLAPLAFDGSLAMALRTFSWRRPYYGALIVLAGGELGAGGGHWWSDSARMTFFGGARLVAQSIDGASNIELTYILAPFEFSGRPELVANSRRVEHRAGITFGRGLLGVGAWVYGVVQSVRLTGGESRISADGFGFGTTLELRFD